MIGFNQFVEYTQQILKIQGLKYEIFIEKCLFLFFYFLFSTYAVMHPVGALEFLVYSWFVSQTSSQLKAIFPREKIEIKFLIFLRDPFKIFLLQICNQCLPRANSQNPDLRMGDSPICRLQLSAFLNVGPKRQIYQEYRPIQNERFCFTILSSSYPVAFSFNGLLGLGKQHPSFFLPQINGCARRDR